MAEQESKPRSQRTPEEVKEDLKRALAQKGQMYGQSIVESGYPTWLEREEQRTFTHIPPIKVNPWLEKNRQSISRGNYKRG